MEDSLSHHGILGQKWGKRNGPPYPLDPQDHSASEKKAGWRKSLTKDGAKSYNKSADLSSDQSKEKHSLTDKQKKMIVIGAAAVATTLAVYGTYRLAKSGKLDKLIEAGKKKADILLAGELGQENISSFGDSVEKAGKAIKRLSKPESLSETLSKANPLKGTKEGLNNCVPSSIAGFLRQAGYDVVAKSTGGIQQNTGGVIEECFKSAKVLDGSAIKFGRSPKEAAEMLLKRYGENAQGICTIQWRGGSGGHCFSWKIKEGVVSFFDAQQRLSNVDHYWKMIDTNGALTLARLDGLEIDFDALSKYVKFS